MALQGLKALITGSSKGIGLAVAEAMVAEGIDVALNGRDPEALEPVAERLAAAGPGRAIAVAGDLSQPAACARVVRESIEELGGLDILVNNAGVGIFKSIEEMTWEEWRLQVDLNLGGVWAATKAALPALRGSENPWVVNIGSLASRNAFAGGTGYNASKFGLLGMTEAMMLDLRQHGIRVSLVMPGSVNTWFHDREQAPERTWRLEAEDCALAVMQLLAYPKGAHVSRVEMRPQMPERR